MSKPQPPVRPSILAAASMTCIALIMWSGFNKSLDGMMFAAVLFYFLWNAIPVEEAKK